MKITNYTIDIENSSLQDHLRLRQVLLDNGQVIWEKSKILLSPKLASVYNSSVTYVDLSWAGSYKQPNISLQDFINKFRVQPQIRNLAIYKRSGEPWIQEELDNMCNFVDPNESKSTHGSYLVGTKKYFYDDGSSLPYYTWSVQDKSNFKNCLQLAYEDLFPQKQSMNPFKVGDKIKIKDHMKNNVRLSKVRDIIFEVAELLPDNYAAADRHIRTNPIIDGASTPPVSWFELIQSAEPEFKYPLFMKDKCSTLLIKFTSKKGGITLIGNKDYNPGYKSNDWFPHTSSMWEPCDLTTKPEIFDIDWWDTRFNAGLPVWYVLDVTPIQATRIPSSYTSTDKFFTEPMRYIAFGNYYIPWNDSNSCQDNIEANQPIQKEQPMNLQQILITLFGAAKPQTDYEAKPTVIVVAYNAEGTEVATATADSISDVETKLQANKDLWGCKLVCYQAAAEMQTQVPITVTKLSDKKSK